MQRSVSCSLLALLLALAPAFEARALFIPLTYPFGDPSTYAIALSEDGSTVAGEVQSFSTSSPARWQGSWETFSPSLLGGSAIAVSADGSVVVGNSASEPDGAFALIGVSIGFTGQTVSGIPCGGLLTATFDALSVDGATALRTHTCRPFSGQFPGFPPTRAWSLAGPAPLLLPTQSGFASSAFSVLGGSGGTLAGYSSDAGATMSQPFRWTTLGGFQTPPVPLQGQPPTGARHRLTLSADESTIAGTNVGAMGNEAYRWSPEGVTFLGDLDGGSFGSIASGLSADGSVLIGQSTSTSGGEAFRWTAPDGMTGLGDLPGGTFASLASVVSYDGSRIFGSSQTGEGLEAFVWDAGNGMRRLEDVLAAAGGDLAGWRLTHVAAIAPDGLTIIGQGVGPTGRDTAWYAVIPEPSSGALGAIALALVLAARRRSVLR